MAKPKLSAAIAPAMGAFSRVTFQKSSPSRGGVGEAGVVTDEEWRYGHENPPLAGEVARRAGGVVNQTCQCTTLQLAGEVSAKPAEG